MCCNVLLTVASYLNVTTLNNFKTTKTKLDSHTAPYGACEIMQRAVRSSTMISRKTKLNA